MSYIIFSIDNVNDTHTLAKFLRHIDTQRAMGKMKGKMVHCIGMYDGMLEPSFLLTQEDFQYAADYVKGQESVLEVPSSVKQPVSLRFKDRVVCLGRLVSSSKMPDTNAWTHNGNKFYFVEE